MEYWSTRLLAAVKAVFYQGGKATAKLGPPIWSIWSTVFFWPTDSHNTYTRDTKEFHKFLIEVIRVSLIEVINDKALSRHS